MKSCTRVLSVCCDVSWGSIFDRARLAVALHYTEFQAIPALKFQWRNGRHSPLGWTPLVTLALKWAWVRLH